MMQSYEKVIDVSNDVVIGWATILQRKCLKITFKGILTKDLADKASLEWKSVMTSENNGKSAVIFECKEMKDYDPMARIIWQKTINDLKDHIACIWVITDSRLIAAGAAVLGIFSTIKIRTAFDENKIILS